MAKQKRSVGLVSFPVTVTPTAIVPAGSKNVQCDLGPPAIGNYLVLDCGIAYDITFELCTGPNVPQVQRFDEKKPFVNQPNKCPPALPGGTIQKPCALSCNTGASITIHVDALGHKGLTYYRLNFNDDYSWDPIIIHE